MTHLCTTARRAGSLTNRAHGFVLALVLAAAALATPVWADEGYGAVLADAERAMTDGDFVAGVNRYLEAARVGDSVETARQATLTAYLFGFDAVAAEAAVRWAELDVTPWRAQVYGAMAKLRAGDVDTSVKGLRGVLDSGADAESVCDVLEEGLSRNVRNEDAHAALKQVARRYDETPCLSALAAAAALSHDDFDDAERQLDRLRKLGAFDNQARLIAMARLIELEDVDAALSDDELRLDNDATVQQQIEYAFLHARAEQDDTARNMVELLRSEYPSDAEVLEALAVLQLQGGDPQASRRSFLDLLATGEKTADALFYLARFAESDRRFDQALRMYSQVDSGSLAVAAQQRAAALLRESDGVPAAISHIDDFVVRHPRFGLDLLPVKGSLYARGEFYDQALAAYDTYVELKPRAEFAWLARADAILQSGELDDAIAAFRDVVDRFPDSPNALNALGYTLADRTRKYREAERLIDRALKLAPDNAAIIDSKGWVLFRRGKLKQAREYLERAWEDLPDPEVAAHLGEVLWRMGEEQEARDLLEEAWQRFPGDSILRDTIRRLLDDGPLTRS